ncbi:MULTISPECIES: cytochrome c oxidase subunit II [Persicobacter]|uniref:Cytochrome c oxidase subunit 2 n=1 Tax=Persicobacter diffluens TaxID=981 RepID=A0AAN4VZ10_9BACT|nr:cytochrome c oxidase subunit II [Persicobacter sp. CCB-QB2]GJM61681.1 cytochrome-c oxidase [Persicobacter diffluens]
MQNLVILVGALFVLVAIVLVHRIFVLVGVVKGTDKKRITPANKWNAALMVVFLLVTLSISGYYSYVHFDEYTIPIASEHGALTDNLFWITMGVTGVVFIITQVLLFGFSFKYQHNEKKPAFYYPDNGKLEALWTIVPAIVLAALIISGLSTWHKVTGPAPENAEVIEILGYQFAWKVRYPGADGQLGKHDYRLIDADNMFGMDFSDKTAFDDFIPRELHIPVNRPVEFKIRARDVIHSVFIPQFRLKMDAVPGMPTRFHFTATKTTEEMRRELNDPKFNYELACNQICGRGHFAMKMNVVVDSEEDYEKWKAEQKSWLSKNPEYLSRIPEELKELALVKTGMDTEAEANENSL